MNWSQLLEGLPVERTGDEDPVVRGIAYDSRAVSPGDVFVALRGATADGHDYLDTALRLGAVAMLLEEPRDLPVPVAVHADTRRALAPLATRFFGDPARELRLVGVTGTNGKTSTTYLVESILRAAGQSPGLIGTVEARYADTRIRAVNTTPESLDLQRTLRAMCTAQVDAVAMEVSSHGLALGRVEGCHFAVAAVTNVTQDHLDFHTDMADYTAAKTALFGEHLAEGGAAVINLDDASADTFLTVARTRSARILGVSRKAESGAEIALLDADCTLDRTQARIATPLGELLVELPLLGDFNLENMLVAVGIACALDIGADAISTGLANCAQVPGRMERVGTDLPDAPTILVDYAHTPDAVDKLLSAVRPLARGRLITVFGCGGDRDRAKRPLMAEAAARHSDRVIATSDNPRTEDPEAILHDVEAGLGTMTAATADALDVTPRGCITVTDRRSAIALAIEIARPEDAVVIAGKGHEDYQIVGREKFPFDDREEAARALREKRS